MTDQDKSRNQKPNKSHKPQVKLSKAEMELRDEIVVEAVKLAKQETSSAFGIITKTRELLKLQASTL
jgi:hypothetical protein